MIETSPNIPLAILFGSDSSERLVSVASAQNLCQYLPEALLWFWHPQGAYFEIEPQRLLSHQNPFGMEFPIEGLQPFANSSSEMLQRAYDEKRCLVLALHGGSGEDGRFAAECEFHGVPFTGSGSRASHVAFDKVFTKIQAEKWGILTSPYRMLDPFDIRKMESDEAWLEEFGGLVAKPVRDGSSNGLFLIRNHDDYENFILKPRSQKYLLEPFVDGVETTVGVIEFEGGMLQALEPVEIRLPSGRNFDFAGKYLEKTTQELCPSTFSVSVVGQLKRDAMFAHMMIGAEGYSRSDFIVRDHQGVFLEINTLPGLSAVSLLPKELAVESIGMRAFILSQIQLAVVRTAWNSAANQT